MTAPPSNPGRTSMPTKPQDHLPANDEPFVFTRESGETIKVPGLNSLMTLGFSRKHRHLDPAEQVYILLEEKLDEDTLAQVDSLNRTETEEFMTAWQEHAGISVGE
jgi:hypothetical protein